MNFIEALKELPGGVLALLLITLPGILLSATMFVIALIVLLVIRKKMSKPNN